MLKLSGLTHLDWLNITRPLINDIEQSILKSQTDNGSFNISKTTKAEIHHILKKTFSHEPQVNNPAFRDIVNDLLFKVGKMQSEWAISYSLKNSSKLITETLEPYRESYHKTIDTLANSLRNNLLDRDFVKSLFSPEPEKAATLTNQKLAHQISVTARIAHDMIMSLAEEKGSIAKFATRQVITGNANEIDRVITTIYQKLFNNQLINQNLVVLACEKIFHSLNNAAEQVRMQENLRVHQSALEFQAKAI